MNENRDVPVYLFTGFLEAGKTKFIQETLEDKRFCNGERTLLLICDNHQAGKCQSGGNILNMKPMF